MPAAVTVHALTKRYGRTPALVDLDMTIPAGSIFGLLGPNGSGKSTFIKLLMGFIFPDTGRIDRGGLAPARIGYIPEHPFFPPRSRLDEYLLITGQLAGLDGPALRATVAHRLCAVGLDSWARRRINTCSRGMLQRLALAASLLDDPPLLLWDEPLSGLDPAWQKSVRDMTGRLAARGTTVVLSTHDLSEVEQICTDVAILYRGRLVRAGPLGDVLALRPAVKVTVDRLPEPVCAVLAALGPGLSYAGNVITLRDEALSRKAEVLRVLLEAGIDVRGLAEARASLEEIYLEAIRP